MAARRPPYENENALAKVKREFIIPNTESTSYKTEKKKSVNFLMRCFSRHEGRYSVE